MIPRGAAIFFVIGVISAGLYGTYLLEASDQKPVLVYRNGPSLSIIPSKINYHMGEPVTIRIINSGSLPLSFSDSSFGMKIRGLDGTIIYFPPSKNVTSVLNPHEEKIFVWNQTKTGGAKVFEGRYKIESETHTVSGAILKKSVTINILQ